MDIQKQKNLYLAELLEQEVIKQDEFEDLVFKPEINAFHSNYLSSRFIDNINFGWSAWQAATAQKVVVPEGFVLVPTVPSERMVLAVRQCYEGEHYLAYSLYSEFINQAIIERMEAQEQVG